MLIVEDEGLIALERMQFLAWEGYRVLEPGCGNDPHGDLILWISFSRLYVVMLARDRHGWTRGGGGRSPGEHFIPLQDVHIAAPLRTLVHLRTCYADGLPRIV